MSHQLACLPCSDWLFLMTRYAKTILASCEISCALLRSPFHDAQPYACLTACYCLASGMLDICDYQLLCHTPGAEFEVVESELEEPLKSQYSAAARMWSQIRREFLYAIEQASSSKEEDGPKRGNMLWRFFWAAQQRFFRHLCMAAKVVSPIPVPLILLKDLH